MNEIIFEIVKTLVYVVVMAVVAAVYQYAIPLLKKKLEAEDMKGVKRWVDTFVLMAEQVLHSERYTGKDRKKFVMNKITEYLIVNKLDGKITNEQIDSLIEAAVKGMNIAQGKKEEGR